MVRVRRVFQQLRAGAGAFRDQLSVYKAYKAAVSDRFPSALLPNGGLTLSEAKAREQNFWSELVPPLSDQECETLRRASTRFMGENVYALFSVLLTAVNADNPGWWFQGCWRSSTPSTRLWGR